MLLRSLRLLGFFLVVVGLFRVGLLVIIGFLFLFLFLCFFFLLLLNCYYYISHFIYYTDLNDEVSTILKKNIW